VRLREIKRERAREKGKGIGVKELHDAITLWEGRKKRNL
jgi:hypothetical protein